MPISVDEYLVTLADAREIIEQQAADIFNIRVSKLGGIWRTWQIAQMALQAGLKLQFGAQVGETAILSAAGRHLIATLDDILFSEGSAGMLLLKEDVSEESIAFGFQGMAPILQGPGLGITVKEEVLEKYSKRIIDLE
jgi:muconate cycloisomerase